MHPSKTRNPGRARRAAGIVAALELGALSAAALLKVSHHTAPALFAALFRIKMVFSNWLGDLFGWSDHVRYYEPIGAWLQFAFLTAVLGAPLFLLLRSASFQQWRNWIDGVIAVAAPWAFFVVTLDSRSNGGVITQRIGLVAILVGLGAGIFALMGISHGLWSSRRALVSASVIISLAACCALLKLYGDSLTAPVGYAIAAASAILFFTWASASAPSRGRAPAIGL